MSISSTKEIMSERSFNNWIKNYEVALITAFRSEKENISERTKNDNKKVGDTYTNAENRERNRELSASLLRMGYGITKISGVYIENFGMPNSRIADEESFLVVNKNDDQNFYDTIFKLSEYDNQDFFCYKPKGEEVAYNVGTNGCHYPGYGQKDCNGKFVHGVKTEFMNRLKKRGFAYIDNDSSESFYTSYTDSRKERINEKIKQALNAEINIFDDYNVFAKQTIAHIGDAIIHEISLL